MSTIRLSSLTKRDRNVALAEAYQAHVAPRGEAVPVTVRLRNSGEYRGRWVSIATTPEQGNTLAGGLFDNHVLLAGATEYRHGEVERVHRFLVALQGAAIESLEIRGEGS